MKQLKLRFVKWLLKDQTIGFAISNNTIAEGASLYQCTFSMSTYANIILNDVNLPKGTQIIIKNP